MHPDGGFPFFQLILYLKDTEYLGVQFEVKMAPKLPLLKLNSGLLSKTSLVYPEFSISDSRLTKI